jgi:hypothetical protein
MIMAHDRLRRPVTALLLVAAAGLATGCLSQSTNSSEPLLSSGTSSGTGGSGSGSGTGSGTGGTGSPTPNGSGLLSSFDPPNSRVNGYAYNANAPGTSYIVEFFLNGPRGTGTALGQILANQFRFLFPNGNYGYSFTIPMAYQDGIVRQIWAYQVDGTVRNELGNSPMAFWAGENPAGRNVFNTSASPSLNSRCTSCHAIGDYNALKQMMNSPSKFQGGTRENNELINVAKGGGHGGGNICGGGFTGPPCPQIRAWYDAEFP